MAKLCVTKKRFCALVRRFFDDLPNDAENDEKIVLNRTRRYPGGFKAWSMVWNVSDSHPYFRNFILVHDLSKSAFSEFYFATDNRYDCGQTRTAIDREVLVQLGILKEAA